MKKSSEFQLEKAQTAVIIIHVTCMPFAIREEIDRKKHKIGRYVLQVPSFSCLLKLKYLTNNNFKTDVKNFFRVFVKIVRIHAN
jgi:hypothetical protein